MTVHVHVILNIHMYLSSQCRKFFNSFLWPGSDYFARVTPVHLYSLVLSDVMGAEVPCHILDDTVEQQQKKKKKREREKK